jgi:hypothetical protein
MMGKTIPLTAEALFAQKMTITQLEAEKRRLSLLLNSAIANHNDLAIRSKRQKDYIAQSENRAVGGPAGVGTE